VFVGSSDSRIYALRARNGHRLWARDVGERLVRPLAHWHGSLGEPEFDFLVAVPGDGRQVLVLDPFDGRTLASYRLPDTGESLATGPAVTPDGRVAVAVQKYDEKAAALLLLEIRPARTEPGTGDMPYNGGGLDEVAPDRPKGGKAKR
jgi:outer membrane protein assembly factor BamB